jgi:hypothetical protein
MHTIGDQHTSGPGRRSRWLLLGLLGALAATLGVRWATERLGLVPDAPVVAVEDQTPEGRWHRTSLMGTSDPVELARLLSLPYMAGRLEAPEEHGVRFYDQARAAPGVNLYTSGHGPEAILMDMDGEVLHRWSRPFTEAFPGRPPTRSTAYFRRSWMLPDGDLLALYQTGGLARLAPDSSPRWALDLPAYNHVFVDHRGEIWTLTKRAVERPEIRRGGIVLEDSLVRVSPEGRVLEEISLLDAMLGSEYAHLLAPLPEHEDIFHSNTLVVFDGSWANAGGGLFQEGHVLFSLRDVDVVGILDPGPRRVTWARRGPWKRQHQPLPSGPGTIVLFDNRGFGGRARVLEYDLAKDAVTWQFPAPEDEPLYSHEGGSVQVLANGNLLISESERGRALEITRQGEVVWEFVSPHRAGRYRELVAGLWEVLRLEPEMAEPLLEAGVRTERSRDPR